MASSSVEDRPSKAHTFWLQPYVKFATGGRFGTVELTITVLVTGGLVTKSC